VLTVHVPDSGLYEVDSTAHKGMSTVASVRTTRHDEHTCVGHVPDDSKVVFVVVVCTKGVGEDEREEKTTNVISTPWSVAQRTLVTILLRIVSFIQRHDMFHVLDEFTIHHERRDVSI
jgi:hypothetical protein